MLIYVGMKKTPDKTIYDKDMWVVFKYALKLCVIKIKSSNKRLSNMTDLSNKQTKGIVYQRLDAVRHAKSKKHQRMKKNSFVFFFPLNNVCQTYA